MPIIKSGHPLPREEEAFLANAVLLRRREFATGRVCARSVRVEVDCAPLPVRQGEFTKRSGCADSEDPSLTTIFLPRRSPGRTDSVSHLGVDLLGPSDVVVLIINGGWTHPRQVPYATDQWQPRALHPDIATRIGLCLGPQQFKRTRRRTTQMLHRYNQHRSHGQYRINPLSRLGLTRNKPERLRVRQRGGTTLWRRGSSGDAIDQAVFTPGKVALRGIDDRLPDTGTGAYFGKAG
jgi:hypothetical protein